MNNESRSGSGVPSSPTSPEEEGAAEEAATVTGKQLHNHDGLSSSSSSTITTTKGGCGGSGSGENSPPLVSESLSKESGAVAAEGAVAAGSGSQSQGYLPKQEAGTSSEKDSLGGGRYSISKLSALQSKRIGGAALAWR